MSAADLRGPGVPGDGNAAAGDALGAVTPNAHAIRADVGDITTAADHPSIAGAGTPGVSDSTTAGDSDSTTAGDSDSTPAGVGDSADMGAHDVAAADAAAASPGSVPPARDPADAGRGGGSPVTLYDVARLAGVSTATVSRVLHGQDRVRDSTRARVRDIIDQLGYVPDGAAQSLSRRQKNVIGLVGVERMAPHQYDIESMSLLFYDEILRGVEQRIRDYNWSLLITYLREENNVDLARLQSLSGKVDGLLIGEGIVPSPELARLAERLPVVVVAGDPAEHSADVVTADNRSGQAALVTHLVEDHGRRRLYHVDGPQSAPDAKERRLALNEVIQAHPGTVLVGSHCGRFSVQSGEEAGEKILADRGDLPDAVVCANDQMAIGVLQRLARGGIRVPEHLAVTGFDDIFPGSLFEPSLTTVHQPMRLLGERACARLLDRIARPDLPTQVELLPTELVLRKSCGCPPGVAARTIAAPLMSTIALSGGSVVSRPESELSVTSRGRRRARSATES
jgi:LacI family transcriptional regulator